MKICKSARHVSDHRNHPLPINSCKNNIPELLQKTSSGSWNSPGIFVILTFYFYEIYFFIRSFCLYLCCYLSLLLYPLHHIV